MPNPLCHFEIMTDDPEKCRTFYSAVFDWTFDNSSMPGYTLVNAGTEPTGGIFKRPENAPGVCLNVYFHVHDIEAALGKVKRNGGSVLVPKTPIPNVGHFAMFTDPEGQVIGIMEPT